MRPASSGGAHWCFWDGLYCQCGKLPSLHCINEERVEPVVIDPVYSGPPGTGNGGYSAGTLAEVCGLPAEVTLRKPVPLGTPLQVRPTDTGLNAYHGDTLIAEVRPAPIPDLSVPPAPAWEAALAGAALAACDTTHPFPGCFVCGTAREDGMRLFAAPAGAGVVAAPWQPAAALAHPDGTVMLPFVWAALDCPGAAAAVGTAWVPVVLGRITAHQHRPILAGERYLVLGWPLAAQGRKHTVGTAIVTLHGELCAVAQAIWLEIAPSALA